MKKSIVAIVGRPNVGKSTLFNRLCRRRKAIVDPTAGITRDRKYEEIIWNGRSFIIADTGGIIPGSDDQMDQAVRNQAQLAIKEADFILFMVDAYTGTTDMDMEIARILRPYSAKVMLVANKVDNEKLDLDLYDFLQLGFGEPFPISAEGGRNTGNFLDAVMRSISTDEAEEFHVSDPNTFRVAIAGRPNVGKSSIVNRLIGADTVIVTDIPGTTRDSIDTRLQYFGKNLILVDTAGLRRKKNVDYGVEYFSVMRTIESIKRSDVVLLVIDAAEGVADQDKKIASYAHRNYKDIIIVINKWDLIKKDNKSVKEFTKVIRDEMTFLEYCPILFVSALTGQRVRNLLKTVLEVEEESHKRIPTHKLNEFMKKTLTKLPPTSKSGKAIKLYYAVQAKVHPPVFVFFCNDPELLTVNWKRFLYNQIREEFGFGGATVKIVFRGREKNDMDSGF